jgi:hypothetical protein
MPAQVYQQQYVMPVDEVTKRKIGIPIEGLVIDAEERSPIPIKELVFFGRLETRKGLKLFCNALRAMEPELNGIQVTFLGRINLVDNKLSDSYLHAALQDASFSWQILSSLDRADALSYLKVPGRLAVICSPVDNSPCTVYEAIEYGIPFIASTGGGIPELIHPNDRQNVLFDYDLTSLLERLRSILTLGAILVRPAVTRQENQNRWINGHLTVWSQFQKNNIPEQSRMQQSVAVILLHDGSSALADITINSLLVDNKLKLVDILAIPVKSGANTTMQLPDHLTEDAIISWGVGNNPATVALAISAVLQRTDAEAFLIISSGACLKVGGGQVLVDALFASEVDGVVPFHFVQQGEGISESTNGKSHYTRHVTPTLSGSRVYALLNGTSPTGCGIFRRAAMEQLANCKIQLENPLYLFDVAVLENLTILPLPEPLIDATCMMQSSEKAERDRLTLLSRWLDPDWRFALELAFGLWKVCCSN